MSFGEGNNMERAIKRSAEANDPPPPKVKIPELEVDGFRYNEIMNLLINKFDIPLNRKKVRMFDYDGRDDVLINIYVPNPSGRPDALLDDNIIIAYRYHYSTGDVEKA